MSESKGQTEAKERPKKPPGYRNFTELLRQIVKAPPMKQAQDKPAHADLEPT